MGGESSGYDLSPLTPEEVETRVDTLTELQKIVLTKVSDDIIGAQSTPEDTNHIENTDSKISTW